MSDTRTFADVMEDMPFQTLWELLNNPRDIDKPTLDNVISWTRPARIQNNSSLWEAALKTSLFASKSQVTRSFHQKSLRWNGELVTDIEHPATLLKPGWGVFKMGKKSHAVVIADRWVY